MSKKAKFDEDDYEEYFDSWSDYKDQDGKRLDRKKQHIETARRAKFREKDAFFSEKTWQHQNNVLYSYSNERDWNA